MSIEIRQTWEVNGVLTDVTSMTLLVTRADTSAVVVSGVAMTHVSDGTYSYTLEEDTEGLTYFVTPTVVYEGQTYVLPGRLYSSVGLFDLASDADVALHLDVDLTDAAFVQWLSSVRPKIEQVIFRHIGYDPRYAERTRIIPEVTRFRQPDPLVRDFDVRAGRLVNTLEPHAEDADKLICPDLPIRSVAKVWENPAAYGGQATDDFTDDMLLTQGVDFYVDWAQEGLGKSGALKRMYMNWPSRPRTVKVQYTTGYTQQEVATGIASDLGLAFMTAAQYWFWQRGRNYLPISSERIGHYSVSYSSTKLGRLPREAQRILQPFVHYGRIL